MKAALKAQINKTDRNDARGIAQMMRVGLYRPVHVKTLRSQKLRVLLTHRTSTRGAYDWSAPRLRHAARRRGGRVADCGARAAGRADTGRSEEHTSELQSLRHLV